MKAVIIGSGMIGEIHRRSALLAGAEIVGVMASSPVRSEEAAVKWHTKAVRGLEEIAGLQPDVVHVCSPNALHEAHVAAALQAGAHVICEKPLATSVESAQRLLGLAEQHRRIATVPYVYRFHPLIRELRARVKAGEFGKWQLLHGSYLQDWLLDPLATSWRVSAKVGGESRAFADIGSHWCDLVEFVTGERIASLIASATITVPERPEKSAATFGGAREGGALVKVETEDAASIMFKTQTGVLGSVVVSQVSAGRKNRLWFELDGAHQSAVFDQELPESVWIGTEFGACIINRDPSQGAEDQRRLSSLPPGHAQGYAQCFDNFVRDTYDAIRGTIHDGLPGFADGVRSTRIIDAVMHSARTQQWVAVQA